MDLKDQLLIKRMENVDVFLEARKSQFAPTSRATALHAELKQIIGRLQSAQSQQSSSGGAAKGATRAKSVILGELQRDTGRIADTAKEMATLSDEEKGWFLKPSTRELELVSAARSFVEKATPMWSRFVAYEMDADLLSEMTDDLADYDAAYGAQQGQLQARRGAGGTIDEDITRGGALITELRQPIKNKYGDSEPDLLAWASASRYPQRLKKPKPPVPPTT